ncbi:glycoside hydrolase family 19 protein [Mycobacterium kansasii]|uniref:glycoside hydrolase family 19 protein n=1 Tax=Mycobacterium attenuatum TaxID=2341086 RepID=UPI003CC7C9C2
MTWVTTQAGDGPRYKDRGAIQVTGRYNYTKMNKDLGVDFVDHPKLAATPQYAFKTALWCWTITEMRLQTRATSPEMVNGGHHGLAERTECYNRAIAGVGPVRRRGITQLASWYAASFIAAAVAPDAARAAIHRRRQLVGCYHVVVVNQRPKCTYDACATYGYPSRGFSSPTS